MGILTKAKEMIFGKPAAPAQPAAGPAMEGGAKKGKKTVAKKTATKKKTAKK
jgi:hypothetical protein